MADRAPQRPARAASERSARTGSAATPPKRSTAANVGVQAASKLTAAALVVLMLIAAIMIWLGIPLAWLIIGSHVVKSSQPSMGPYLLVFVGIVASVIVMAMIIGRLNRAYERVSGTGGDVEVRMPWMRSMRDSPDAHPATRSMLDVVMVTSVVLAAACAGIWFLLFAGTSLPGA